MADEEPKKTTKTVPLTGTLEESIRGVRDAKKKARMRAIQTMAGRVPSEAQRVAAHTEKVKAFAPVLRELGAIEGRIYDSEEARRKDKVTLTKSYVTNAMDLLETEMRTANAEKLTLLRGRHTYFANVLKALDYTEGMRPRGQRVLNAEERVKQFQKVTSYIFGTKNPSLQKVAHLLAVGFGNKEQRDEMIAELGMRDEAFGGEDVVLLADQAAASFDRVAGDMGLGLTREVADLSDEALTALGVDPADPMASSGFAAGVQLGVDPSGHLASYLAGGPMHPTGYPDDRSSISGMMGNLASALSGHKTGDIQEVAGDFVDEVNMTPEQIRELDGMSYYRQQLFRAMEFPDAPTPVRDAKVKLLSDPNYQAFKSSRGYETHQAAVKDLTKMLRKTDRGRRKRDRYRAKAFRGANPQDEKTRKVFEALRAQEAEAPKKGSDSADLTQGATSPEDVSDFTKKAAKRDPLGLGK